MSAKKTATGENAVQTLTEEEKRQASIWLEVANIRLVGKRVEIQVKGDRADREPVWWEVKLVQAGFGEPAKEAEGGQPAVPEKPDHNTAYRTITDGLDKKKIVLANLAPDSEGDSATTLKCTSIRVQYAESNSR
jgi:hypothetical protein